MIDSSSILEINIKNFIHNYKTLQKVCNKSNVGATIKANAYGLGDIKLFKILYQTGCRNFFVSSLNEALKIRSKYKVGFLYVLNGVEKKYTKILLKKNIIPVINSSKDLGFFLKKENIHINIGVHIDTGINRLGIPIKHLEKFKNNNRKIFILLSHFASSDEKLNNYNVLQNKKFKESFKFFKNVKFFSLANSMGTILNKNYHYDIVRPGISLYGGHYNTKLKKLIKPVIKLKAKILQIKEIKKGEFIGYNQTFKTSKNITVAILGIGYADGLSRLLSNKGKVFFRGKKFNIIGRVSMDSITVDVSKHKKIIKTNDFMEIINHDYGIDKMAEDCNTISNEILTAISNRVKRTYL